MFELHDDEIDPGANCPICGYSQHSLPVKHVCPECGFEYDQMTRILRSRATGRILHLEAVLACIFLILGMLLTIVLLSNPIPTMMVRVLGKSIQTASWAVPFRGAAVLAVGLYWLASLLRTFKLRVSPPFVAVTSKGVVCKSSRGIVNTITYDQVRCVRSSPRSAGSWTTELILDSGRIVDLSALLDDCDPRELADSIMAHRRREQSCPSEQAHCRGAPSE
jgi:rubredoxin